MPFKLQNYPKIISYLLMIISCLVMLGWILDIEILQTVLPGFVSMKFNTALCFLFLGIALYSASIQNQDLHLFPFRYLLFSSLSILTALIGVVTLGEYIFQQNFGIDQLIFQDTQNPSQVALPGRMSPNTAANFLFIGTALFLAVQRSKASQYLSNILSIITFLVALFSGMGLIYNVPFFYSISIYTGMALHTTFCFVLLSIAVFLIRPIPVFIKMIRPQSLGLLLLQRLLPTLLIILILLGYFRLVGEKRNYFGLEFGIASYTLIFFIIISAFIFWSAFKLNQLEELKIKNLEALAEKDARFRAIAESAQEGIVLADHKGIITLWNKGCENIFGYDEKEILGKDLTLLMPEKYRRAHLKGMQRFQLTGEAKVLGKVIELQGLKKDGSEFPLELSLSSWKQGEQAYFGGILRNITDRKKNEADQKNYTVTLQKINLELARREKIMQSLLEDLQERKIQLSQKTSELSMSNQELEQFAYVASHDLQEPLRKILAFSERLEEKAKNKLGDEEKDYLQRMCKAALRMKTLIEDLLQYSRVGTNQQPYTMLDLNQILNEVISDLEARIEQSGGKIELGNLGLIEADALQIRQLFQNLISNALKFHKAGQGSHVQIKSKNIDDRIILTIEDNGIGFDMKFKERIFQPFQRLHGKSEYEGTGIGLAVCQKIVERHHGNIQVQSEEGKGTCFVITLPVKQNNKGNS